MNVSITATNPKNAQYGQTFEVNAYKTASPVLVVHRGLYNRNSWTITHVPTQAIVQQHFATRAGALACANKFAAILDWNTVTMENAGKVFVEYGAQLIAAYSESKWL